MLPNLLIAGAAKSGTSSMCEYLAQHPDVYVPRTKEPWFLAVYGEHFNNEPVLDRISVVNSLDAYGSLYAPGNSARIRIDGSTAYLYRFAPTIRNVRATWSSGDLPKVLL